MFIPFKNLTPDLAPYQSEGLQLAKNTLPGTNSYQSFPDTVSASAVLANTCVGGTYLKDDEGNVYNYAGTAAALYRIETDTTVTNISKAGGYNTESTDIWNFVQWGQDLIATNFADPIQSLTVPTQTLFADLSASAPKARYLARVRDFLVAFNTQDSVDGVRPTRVWNSALNDPTSWSASVVTEANFVDLDTGDGNGMGVVGGEYGVLFQERAITRMTYVGAPEIFQYDTVERGRGTRYPNSIVQFGNFVAYLGSDGFYVFDGQRSQSIGDGEVNRTVLNDIDNVYFNKVIGKIDPVKKYIFWIYPSISSSVIGTLSNKIVCFNFASNTDKKWSIGDLTSEMIVQSASPGYTLDNMDTVMPSIDIKGMASFDSARWQGGELYLGIYNAVHQLRTFSSPDDQVATFRTGEYEFFPGKRTFIKRVKIMTDALLGSTNGIPNVSVRVGVRSDLTQEIVWTGFQSPSQTLIPISGDITIRANGRFVTFEVVIRGKFSNIQGIEILDMVAAGSR